MKALLILPVLILTGCAGYGYALKHYSDVPLVKHETADGTYRIFDKPHANRMMITPTIGSSIGGGLARGLTLGAVDASGPKPIFQDAALSYLAKTGRDCRILDGYVVVDPQWEFTYECASMEGKI